MSKDKPEVGDVWEITSENDGVFKVLVINTTSFKHPYCITDSLDGYFLHSEDVIDLKYLGISTTDVMELFEISDETFIEQ